MPGSSPLAFFPYTSDTKAVAGHTLASLILEALADLNYSCVSTRAEYKGQEAEVGLYCRSRVLKEDIEEVINYVRMKTRLDLATTLLDEPRDSMMSYREHLRQAVSVFTRLLRSQLKPLLRESVEYALAILWSGESILVKGSKRSVRTVGNVYSAIAHTHPGGLCLPSPHDIQAIADRLADGACCEAILANSCMLIAYRVDTLTLEDYDTLMELARKLGKIKEFDRYVETLSAYTSMLKTVRIRLESL